MVTASSKEPLRRSLDGISAEVQGTDYSEVAYDTGEFVSPSSPALRTYHLPQSWRRQSAELDYLPPVILHLSPTHVLVFRLQEYKVLQKCCWK